MISLYELTRALKARSYFQNDFRAKIVCHTRRIDLGNVPLNPPTKQRQPTEPLWHHLPDSIAQVPRKPEAVSQVKWKKRG